MTADSFSLQKNIKDNSVEVQEFIKDLKSWEKDIKLVDEKLSCKSGSILDTTLPPVRSRKTLSHTGDSKDATKRKKSKSSASVKMEGVRKISAYDYAAWDKFDVEKALESSTDEEDCPAAISNKSPYEKEQITLERDNAEPQLASCKISDFISDDNEDAKARALALKDEGNKCYSDGKFEDAVSKYTEGMALDPTNGVLPANRAMAYIKLKKFLDAEVDCKTCLDLNPIYIKGFLRRATARMNLGKVKQAMEDYGKVLDLEPWNKEAPIELEKLSKSIKRDPLKTEIICTKNQHSSVNKIETKSNNESSLGKFDTQSSVFSDLSVDQKSNNSAKNDSVSKDKKKIKIMEVDSSKQPSKFVTDPNIVLPIHKPPNEQSKMPLKRIKVVDIPTKKHLPKHPFQANSTAITSLNIPETQDIHKPSEKVTKSNIEVIQNDNVNLTQDLKENIEPIPVLPPVPRTSHQFIKDWEKISQHPSVAVTYLKNIPPKFFRTVELEADNVVEVSSTLLHKDVSSKEAGVIILSVSESLGFSVNVMFLDSCQKKVLLDVLTKCEQEIQFKESINKLKVLL